MIDKNRSREEIIDDWVKQEAARLRKERRKRFKPSDKVGVTINSLMDAMTIILIFLLINWSVDPLRINPSSDLMLPASTTELTPEVSAAVTVTASEIIFNDRQIARIKNGAVDKVYKQGDEQSLQIQPLFEALHEEAGKQKRVATLRGKPFSGLLTVIGHRELPYRLLTEVLYTAGQAEFQKFKFAVLRGGKRG